MSPESVSVWVRRRLCLIAVGQEQAAQDGREPRPHGRAGREAVSGLVGAQERLLHQVLGVGRAAHQAPGQAPQEGLLGQDAPG